MQKTSTFLASLVIMAALALVAILCRPGSGNGVSTKQRRPDITDLSLTSQPTWSMETAAWVSVLDFPKSSFIVEWFDLVTNAFVLNDSNKAKSHTLLLE
jgi:hypothetical protein